MMAVDVRAHWRECSLRAADHAAGCLLRQTPVELGNPCATYALLCAEGLDGTPLQARVVRPSGNGPHPVMLMFHDANRDIRGWHHMTRFVALGYAVVALQNRVGAREVLVAEPLAVGDGLGVAMRLAGDEPLRVGRVLSPVAAAAVEGSLCDALVLAHLLPRISGLDESHVVTWGEGLGGGLALATAAITGAQAACALNPLPSALDEMCSLLDVACIAKGLDCPVLLGTGCLDLQAAPEAQDAIAAGLADVRHIRYPRYGHERVNAFEDEMFAFLVALHSDRA